MLNKKKLPPATREKLGAPIVSIKALYTRNRAAQTATQQRNRCYATKVSNRGRWR